MRFPSDLRDPAWNGLKGGGLCFADLLVALVIGRLPVMLAGDMGTISGVCSGMKCIVICSNVKY